MSISASDQVESLQDLAVSGAGEKEKPVSSNWTASFALTGLTAVKKLYFGGNFLVSQLEQHFGYINFHT